MIQSYQSRVNISIIKAPPLQANLCNPGVAQRGLGYLIMDAATFFRIPDVYIGIALIGCIGFGLDRAISLAETKFVHWSGR